jgi:transposase
VAAARGTAIAVKLRHLGTLVRRQAQELDILKKAVAIFSTTEHL